jgi:hypothetical protein
MLQEVWLSKEPVYKYHYLKRGPGDKRAFNRKLSPNEGNPLTRAATHRTQEAFSSLCLLTQESLCSRTGGGHVQDATSYEDKG